MIDSNDGGVELRILIAEDDAALSEALRFALTQAGYSVDHVAHGMAADEALRTDGFALLILDLGLPRLDGLEVLRRLRKRNTALPVLILSGREQPEEKVTGLDLGADDYLVKPFSLSELQARVRALLRRGTGMAAPTLQHGDLSFDTVARRQNPPSRRATRRPRGIRGRRIKIRKRTTARRRSKSIRYTSTDIEQNTALPASMNRIMCYRMRSSWLGVNLSIPSALVTRRKLRRAFR